ncbi:MAG: hypothetical protein ACRD2G_09755 [Terriglobia bacterium]
MTATKLDGAETVIQLSPKELTILNNALNEVCNALDLWEFSTRMGVAKEEVLKLLQEMSVAVDEAQGRAVQRQQ